MTKHYTYLQRTLFTAIMFAILMCGAAHTATAAPVTFNVNLSILSSPTTQGFIDLQFNPGNTSSPAATAVVSNFTFANATFRPGEVERVGNVTGTLPGNVSFNNGTQLNDLFQGLTFATGSTFNFNVTLDQQGTGGNFGSDFLLYLFAADGQTPLFSTNADGRLLSITLNPNGTAFAQTFGNNQILISAVQTSAAAIPEPATLILLGTGLSGIALRVRRRKQSHTNLEH